MAVMASEMLAVARKVLSVCPMAYALPLSSNMKDAP